MNKKVQFEMQGGHSRQPKNDDNDGFRLVEWLQEKGVVDSEQGGYWISLAAAAIMFALSIYFFSTALGSGASPTEDTPVATTTQESAQF